MAEDCTGADRDWVYRCSAVETIPTRYGRAIEELIHRSSELQTGTRLYEGTGDRVGTRIQTNRATALVRTALTSDGDGGAGCESSWRAGAA